MKNNLFKNIFLLIIIFVSAILSIYFTKNPIYKNVSKQSVDSKNYVLLEKDKQYSSNINIISDYVMAFQINAKWTDSNFELFVNIYDEKDQLIYSNVINYLSKYNNMLLLEKPVINKVGKNFKIEYQLKSAGAIYLLTNTNDELYTEQIVQTKSYWIVSFSFVLLIISSLLLFKINNKENDVERTIPVLLKYASYFLTWISTSFLYLYFLYCSAFENKISLLLVSLICILIVLSSYIAINIYKRNYKGLCTAFLLIAIPISSLYCVLFMPGDGQDEIRHYTKAYSMINGELFSTNDLVNVPKEIHYYTGFENVKKTFSKMLEHTDYKNDHKYTAPSYVPWLYILSSPVIYLCKILDLNMYIGWYAAKVFIFLISMIISYFIIKKAPKKYQLLFFLYILIPMNIYQYTTLSADTLINFAMLGLLALSLSKYEDKTPLNTKDLVCIALSLLFIVFGKKGYWLLIIPSLILLKDSVKATKKGTIKFLSTIGVALILGICWNLILKLLSDNTSTPIYGNLLFQKAGIHYAIQHPITTINTVIRYLFNNLDQYITDFIGYKFVWSKYSVPTILASSYLFLLIFACFISDKVKQISKKSIIIFLGCTLITFGFIVLGFYIRVERSNTVTGYLWGVQGRYFFPVYIIPLICLANSKLKLNINITNILITLCCIIQFIYIYNFVYLVF